MSAAASAAATRLAEIVGESHFVAEAAELARYAIGEMRPTAMVRPGSAQEIAEIAKLAAAERLTIVACGARTKLEMGLLPRKYDLAMDMTRLDRIIAYDPDDLTLSVEAGTPLNTLSGVLAERGQFLPLAVPFSGRATMGGTIASGIDSPLRQFYGTARDFILGMEFVTGGGTLAKSGGRVVKNVTGYDLHKLMVGAFGTLGIITKVNFRTFPLPREARAFVANFDSADRALDLRGRLSRSALKPLSMEIFSPGAAELFYGEAALRSDPGTLAPGLFTNTSWAFSSRFAGAETVLKRCEVEFSAMAGHAGATKLSAVPLDQDARLRGRQREFLAIALLSSPAATIIKASVVPSRMPELLEQIESAASGESLRCVVMARGVGVIYAALLPDARNEQVRMRVARVTDRIQSACEKAGANATIPWCPNAWKAALRVWGAERGDVVLMRKLKGVFDPHGILSPGRFVGGI